MAHSTSQALPSALFLCRQLPSSLRRSGPQLLLAPAVQCSCPGLTPSQGSAFQSRGVRCTLSAEYPPPRPRPYSPLAILVDCLFLLSVPGMFVSLRLPGAIWHQLPHPNLLLAAASSHHRFGHSTVKRAFTRYANHGDSCRFVGWAPTGVSVPIEGASRVLLHVR